MILLRPQIPLLVLMLAYVPYQLITYATEEAWRFDTSVFLYTALGCTIWFFTAFFFTVKKREIKIAVKYLVMYFLFMFVIMVVGLRPRPAARPLRTDRTVLVPQVEIISGTAESRAEGSTP